MTAPKMTEIYDQEGWTSHATALVPSISVHATGIDGGPGQPSTAPSSDHAAHARTAVTIDRLSETEAQALTARFGHPLDLLRHLGLIEADGLARVRELLP